MILNYNAIFKTTLTPCFPESVEPYSYDECLITVLIDEQRHLFLTDNITADQGKQYGFIFLKDISSSTFLSGNAERLERAIINTHKQLKAASPMVVCMPFEKLGTAKHRFSYDSNGDVTTSFLAVGHTAFSLGSLFLMTLSDLSSWTNIQAFIPKEKHTSSVINALICQLLEQPQSSAVAKMTIAEQLKHASAVSTYRRRLLRVFAGIAPLLLISQLATLSNATFNDDILEIAKQISSTKLESSNENNNPFDTLAKVFQHIHKIRPNEAPSIVFRVFHNSRITERLLCIKNRRDALLSAFAYVNRALNIAPHLLKALPFEYESLFLPSVAYAHNRKWPDNAQQIAHCYQQLLSATALTISGNHESSYLISLARDVNLITTKQLQTRFRFDMDALPSVLDHLLTTHPHDQAVQKIAQLKTKSPATLFEKLRRANITKANEKGYFDALSKYMMKHYESLSLQERLQLYAKANKIVKVTLEDMIGKSPISEVKDEVFLQHQYEATCLLRAYKIGPIELLAFNMTEKLKTWCISQLSKI